MTKNPKQWVGILGNNKIASATASLYKKSFFGNPLRKSENRQEFHDNLYILNVCIPWYDGFIEEVVREQKETNARMVLIHSIIIPYTIQKLRELLPKSVSLAYIPALGDHSKITNFKNCFKKLAAVIGVETEADGEDVKEHYLFLGSKKVMVHNPAVITELGQLLNIGYWTVCLDYTNYAHGVLKKYKLKPEYFWQFNMGINHRLRKMGLNHAFRPVFNAASKRKIGGWYAIPHFKLLQQCQNDPLLEAVLMNQPK